MGESINEPAIFILAEQALNSVVAQIKPEQWDLQADDLSARSPATLRELINYHAYDSLFVPDTLAGKTVAEVGDAHTGDLLGGDPAAGYARASAVAIEAVRNFPAADLDKPVHLSYGDFPAREYLKHITSYRGFRAYSIAKFIGADTTLPPELVDGLWEEVVPEVENWRAMGVFGPAIDPPADADKQTQLLCLTGFYKS
jgi:hypothetical protein